MISALLAWGIGFGGVHYLATHGLSVGAPAPPESAHRIFRALITGTGDLLRYGEGAGATDLFRPGAPPGGKVFR